MTFQRKFVGYWPPGEPVTVEMLSKRWLDRRERLHLTDSEREVLQEIVLETVESVSAPRFNAQIRGLQAASEAVREAYYWYLVSTLADLSIYGLQTWISDFKRTGAARFARTDSVLNPIGRIDTIIDCMQRR